MKKIKSWQEFMNETLQELKVKEDEPNNQGEVDFEYVREYLKTHEWMQ